MLPFRFGILVNNTTDLPENSKQWAEYARRVEDLGYSSLLLTDHFWEQLAPVPAIMAAADATTTLRVGALMLCNDYRHPAVLAKEVATLDLLSDGRLEMGLGAGWKSADYEQTGITKDPAPVRVDRLTEAVAVLKGLLGPEPFTFTGKHYAVSALDSTPKPVQRPHPPLIMGGGSKRVLSLAAREADIVSINRALRSGKVDKQARNDSSAAATDQKIAWVREAARGRDELPELNMVVPDLVLTPSRRRQAEERAAAYDLGTDEVLQVPHLWLGTAEQIAEDVVQRRERWGVSYLAVVGADYENAAPIVERLTGT